jgi:hypothetical protein
MTCGLCDFLHRYRAPITAFLIGFALVGIAGSLGGCVTINQRIQNQLLGDCSPHSAPKPGVICSPNVRKK